MIEPGKHYFPESDQAFKDVHQWACIEIKKKNCTLTGKGECTAAYIAGNKDGDTPAERSRWNNLYHFSRTAQRTLRSHMLMLLFNLRDVSHEIIDGYYIPEGSEPASIRNANLCQIKSDDQFTTLANDERYLAKNLNDMKKLVSSYDKLFTYDYIAPMIKDRSMPRNDAIRRLVVVDTEHFVFWIITTTLGTSRIPVEQKECVFPQVNVTVAFERYELREGQLGTEVFKNSAFFFRAEIEDVERNFGAMNLEN